MSEQPGGPTAEPRVAVPGDRPPRRLLDQAPGERIAARAAAATAQGHPRGPAAPGDRAARRASLVRASSFGLIAAAAGLAAYVVAALVLLWVGLLLVVAATAGYLVAIFTSYGASYGAGADRAVMVSRAHRVIAVLLACGVVIAGLAIAWAASGRYLDPLDFAAQVYGLTIPLQLVGAAVGALVGIR
jgi:hypothetical protein